MIGVLLALLAAHVVASDVCFLVGRKLLRDVERPSNLRLFALTRGLGPLAVASVSYAALVFLPGRGRWFYLALLTLALLLPVVLCRREWPRLVEAYAGSFAWARRHLRREHLPARLACAFALVGVVLGVWLPIVEHDALAAAIESRIAARDASFGNYLAIVEPDPETGYFMETFRTPSLQSLYVFYTWIAGTERVDLLIRTTSPIYALHCLLLVYLTTLRHHSRRAAGWAALLLASTPIFFYMSYNNGIDTTRLYIAFVALLWLVELAATGSRRVAVLTGAASGLAFFCHLLSVPALVGGGLGFVLWGRPSRPRKIVLGVLVALVATATGSAYHFLLAPKTLEKIDQAFESAWAQELLRVADAPDEPEPDEPEPDQPETEREPPPKFDSTSETSPRPGIASHAPGTASAEGAESQVQIAESAPTRSTAPPPAGSSPPAAAPTRPSTGAASSPAQSRADSLPPASGPPAVPTAEPELAQTQVDTFPADSSTEPLEPELERKTTSRQTSQKKKGKPDLAVDRHASLLEARGQGQGAWSHLIFGRLQMFTGIEYFGLLFYFFCAGLGLLAMRRQLRMTDWILLASSLTVAAVVLSGIRQLSWSNPRYIGSLLLIAAYFSGPALAAFDRRWLGTKLRLWTALAVLLFPVMLVTAIRGAKIELTNPGTFYSDFRSLAWVDATLDDPVDAVSTFAGKYLGIRKTAAYIFAERDEQLRHAHDYFAATLWTREHLPDNAKLFVFRDARFFYYGRHRASVWYSPILNQRRYRFSESPEALNEYLRRLGFSHVLVDDYSTRLPGFVDRHAGAMLNDEALAEEIFEVGTARVYRLLDSPRP